MEKIQEILFEHKETIPEGIYLKLMNELKIAYPNRNANDLIKITYTRIFPKFRKNEYGYDVKLLTNQDETIIVKKGDIKNPHYCDTYNDAILEKFEAIPFKPFWYDRSSSGGLFKSDSHIANDAQYIFETIKKHEPDNEDDDWIFDEDNEGEKRNIRFMLCLNYDIKYLITAVEKL